MLDTFSGIVHSPQYKKKSKLAAPYMEIKYDIEIFDRFDVTTSEPIWKYLEKLAKPKFFLSWQWISTWLQTYDPDICVVLACFDQKRLGAC
jgi:hypothetical protein